MVDYNGFILCILLKWIDVEEGDVGVTCIKEWYVYRMDIVFYVKWYVKVFSCFLKACVYPMRYYPSGAERELLS
jgi:hypothetical protein